MDSYLDKVFKFIKRSRTENEIFISLRLWNISDNGKSKENKFIHQQLEREFKLDYPLEEKLAHCNSVKLGEKIFLNQAAVFDWPDNDREEIDRKGFCYGLREQVAILVDGTVVPCCLDKEGIINLGNINNENFDDIVQSKRAQALYYGFSKREAVEALCRKCGYRNRFRDLGAGT